MARTTDRVPTSDVKTYDVPGIGPITLDREALEVPDDDQLLIVCSRRAEKLDLLRVDPS